jgi:hypothetical protein
MLALAAGVPGKADRFYLCRNCRRIRWETALGPGLLGTVHWLPADARGLPASVRAEAAAILSAPDYQQKRLL